MRPISTKGLSLIVILLCLASTCSAGVVYTVNIDTSSQAGVDGAIYLQFNGGLNPDPASISILNFSIGAPGTLNLIPAPVASGDVTGSLDSLPLTIANTGGNNDYLHYLTFGSHIIFNVSFDHPLVLAGDSGSAFSFGLTANDGLTPVLTVDQSGFIGQIFYDTAGAFTTDTLGNDAIEAVASAVPEPGTMLLLAGALFAGGIRLRRD